MNNDTFADAFYSLLRNETVIDRNTVRELQDNDLIVSHRDFYNSGRDELISKAREKCISQRNIDRLGIGLEKKDELINKTGKLLEYCQKENIEIISTDSQYYPYSWTLLSGMPKVFYAKGNLSLIDSVRKKGSVAVVGSRNPSGYAKYATETMVRELASKGIVIVSGMALGTDGYAHQAALSAGGETIGIVPGGVDYFYPPQNKDLYMNLYDKGLIISEMLPGKRPVKQYFPARNRLIASLGDCVLIMEAGEHSGTLHTAAFASGQGKEVLVLPNNIYSDNAKGGLKLLKDGAGSLIDTEDVIDIVIRELIYRSEVNYISGLDGTEEKAYVSILRKKAENSPESLSLDEWKIIIKDILTIRSMTADDIDKMVCLPAGKLYSLLTDMEYSGLLRHEGAKYALTNV